MANCLLPGLISLALYGTSVGAFSLELSRTDFLSCRRSLSIYLSDGTSYNYTSNIGQSKALVPTKGRCWISAQPGLVGIGGETGTNLITDIPTAVNWKYQGIYCISRKPNIAHLVASKHA